MKIPFKDRNQMTMKEKIANPLSVKEALELSEEIRKSIIPVTDCWGNEINHSNFNKRHFAVRMSKGLVTQAVEEQIRAKYGHFCDLYSPSHGSDAPYFADNIIDIDEFNKTHYPDGRAKSKAVFM